MQRLLKIAHGIQILSSMICDDLCKEQMSRKSQPFSPIFLFAESDYTGHGELTSKQMLFHKYCLFQEMLLFIRFYRCSITHILSKCFDLLCVNQCRTRGLISFIALLSVSFSSDCYLWAKEKCNGMQIFR